MLKLIRESIELHIGALREQGNHNPGCRTDVTSSRTTGVRRR